MNTAQLINRIFDKLRTGRVEFTFVRPVCSDDEENTAVMFRYGNNKYHASVGVLNSIRVQRLNEDAEALVTDTYSEWVQGVLNGLVRTESGKLVPSQ